MINYTKYALIKICMPELEEFFSTKGVRGGKPSAGGASKGSSASTASNTSARSERYPSAAQQIAEPAKAPSKQAKQITGKPPRDPPCTSGSSGEARRQIAPKKTGIISVKIFRYFSYQ